MIMIDDDKEEQGEDAEDSHRGNCKGHREFGVMNIVARGIIYDEERRAYKPVQ